VDELRGLLAQLIAKELPEDFVVNAGVGGSALSFTNVLAAPLGDLKPYAVEAPISVEERSNLGSTLARGGGVELMATLRRLTMEFLRKIRVEVDRVICFGLGFRVKASKELRKRMGWVFSRLGSKPKFHFGRELRGGGGGGRKPRPLVKGPRVKAGSGQGDALKEFVSALPETNRTSPAAYSSNLAVLEVAQCSPAMINAGFGLMGSLNSPELAQISPVGVEENPALIGSNQFVSETLISSSEFVQIVPVGVEEIPHLIEEMPDTRVLLELGQISPENTQTATVGVSINLQTSELAPKVLVGTSSSSEAFGLVVSSEGPVLDLVWAVPKALLLVHGLTEVQAWFLGWLRDGTRSPELLVVIDCMEAGTRRKNEVAPPPVCSSELSKLKAKLAGIRDENRENVVRSWALSIAASLRVC
jgi:hypothetical protein